MRNAFAFLLLLAVGGCAAPSPPVNRLAALATRQPPGRGMQVQQDVSAIVQGMQHAQFEGALRAGR